MDDAHYFTAKKLIFNFITAIVKPASITPAGFDTN